MTSPNQVWRPRWLLAGFAVGMLVMAVVGWRSTKSDFHPNFTRFIPAISPEASYYPTVREMAAIVRARCRPDQILVIVGGNSVLQGVWQPAPLMWTRRLQDLLGDQYVVVNFALRGAAPADGGAVVAEALRSEFPRQIYIANEKAVTGFFPIGVDAYQSIFWNAYFGGQLLGDAARDAQVRRKLIRVENRARAVEYAGSAWLDRLLRFNDFWNRVAMEHFNSVPSLYAPAPPGMFSPRKLFVDEERDGSALSPEERYLPSVRDKELEILRATSEPLYKRTATGDWRMDPDQAAWLDVVYRDAFPAALHSRTMVLIGRDSPFFRNQLSPAEFARDERAIGDTVTMLRARGYAAVDYGRDFLPEDYGDRTHLAPTGGRKLAETVAPEIRKLSEHLGYLR